uniref:Secreted protein n=1 Tax=Anopheles darlingi TaxID=43151 RepID=A0A2M4DDR1_ANODA
MVMVVVVVLTVPVIGDGPGIVQQMVQTIPVVVVVVVIVRLVVTAAVARGRVILIIIIIVQILLRCPGRQCTRGPPVMGGGGGPGTRTIAPWTTTRVSFLLCCAVGRRPPVRTLSRPPVPVPVPHRAGQLRQRTLAGIPGDATVAALVVHRPVRCRAPGTPTASCRLLLLLPVALYALWRIGRRWWCSELVLGRQQPPGGGRTEARYVELFARQRRSQPERYLLPIGRRQPFVGRPRRRFGRSVTSTTTDTAQDVRLGRGDGIGRVVEAAAIVQQARRKPIDNVHLRPVDLVQRTGPHRQPVPVVRLLLPSVLLLLFLVLALFRSFLVRPGLRSRTFHRCRTPWHPKVEATLGQWWWWWWWWW